MKKIKALRFSDRDNVVVALESGAAGDFAEWHDGSLELAGFVPSGFKAALRDIAAGEALIKYGEPIGVAKCKIKAGTRVHEDNISSALSGVFEPERWAAPKAAPHAKQLPSFMGYRRKNGRVGIRNELWIIPTVGCIGGLLREIARDYRAPEHITAVRVIEHPWGCSQLGGDLENTRRLLSGLAHNPNAAGVLMAAMGCENLSLSSLLEEVSDAENLRALTLQEVSDERAAVFGALNDLADNADRERTICKPSELVFGIKCGGSDSMSGVTANPLLGRVTELYTAAGGSVLMGELPEMFGAERVILARCADAEVHSRLSGMLQGFRDYFISHGQPVCENPSPGNKAGGISTLEEKSLGAVSKSGMAIVTDALEYGRVWKKKGLSVVWSPGNDLVSCSAMAAAGAVMILFTTGRGTPYGTVVPTLKISTNADLAKRKPNWIDFDASVVMTEGIDSAAASLIDKITETACGAVSRNEENGIAEISIFKDGVIL